jgi:biopolymer transport protein ExbD
MGISNPKIETTDFTKEGIRKIITKKNKEVPDLVIVIKAMKTSKYKNMVDILDEIHNTGSKRYAIVAITPNDLDLIKTI